MSAFHADDWGSNPHSALGQLVRIPHAHFISERVSSLFMSTQTAEYFSSIRSEYANNSITSALDNNIITHDDADLIREFLAERRTAANISQGRVNKITFTLVSWRRFLGPYRTLSIAGVYSGIEALKKGKSTRGQPFKPNTIADHVIILKQFLLWLVEEQYSTLPEKKVSRIKNPRKNTSQKRRPTCSLRKNNPDCEGLQQKCRSCHDTPAL